MIVVSDTTPLVTLMKAGRLSILYSLFGEVRIPEAVFQKRQAMSHLRMKRISFETVIISGLSRFRIKNRLSCCKGLQDWISEKVKLSFMLMK